MTLIETTKLVGTVALCNLVKGLFVPVNVLDARIAFGRIDLKVTPVGGRGELWVENNRFIENSTNPISTNPIPAEAST